MGKWAEDKFEDSRKKREEIYKVEKNCSEKKNIEEKKQYSQ